MSDALLILALIVFALLALFVLPRFLMRRAVFKVINIFQQHNATDAKRAKTIDELGLSPRTFTEGIFRGRDYKPHALRLLMKAEIVRLTQDGKVYLSEEKLVSLGLYKR